MEDLLQLIKRCTICEKHLPYGANPVMNASSASKIVIIGQAPGKKVHETHVPWNDKSGDNLRTWLGVDRTTFYNPTNFALMPMGFCYPGTGSYGDLPPRPECAPQWHPKLWQQLKHVQLTLLIGQYAQGFYLHGMQKKNLTETVKAFEDYLPKYLPLPHPSPRNNIWQKKNDWFLVAVVPTLRQLVANILFT